MNDKRDIGNGVMMPPMSLYSPREWQNMLVDAQKERIKGLELDLTLSAVEIKHGQFILKSCESALSDRDDKIAKLEADKKDLQASLAEAMDLLAGREDRLGDLKSYIDSH